MKASAADCLLTPEFRLLALCAWLDETNWPVQREMVLQGLAGGIDPEKFLSMVKRHRVPVLAYTVLTRAVGDGGIELGWLDRLRPISRQARLRALRLHAEWQRLEKLCLDANIRVRALKGGELSKRLYGDVGMRAVHDIDVLVSPEDMERLLDLLRMANYDFDPGLRPHRRDKLAFRISRRLEHHTQCRSPGGTMVELHSHIERSSHSIVEKEWAKLSWSSDARTMAHFDLLYCTLHGCMHGWSRLKWLGDLRVMAARISKNDWPDVIELAGELRLHALLAETLLLLHWITRFPLPRGAVCLTEGGGAASRRLAQQAFDRMAAPELALHGVRIWDKIRDLQLEWRVGRRLPARERAVHWLTRILFSATDLRMIELPTWLTGLYPVIRPVSVLRRRFFTADSKSR